MPTHQASSRDGLGIGNRLSYGTPHSPPESLPSKYDLERKKERKIDGNTLNATSRARGLQYTEQTCACDAQLDTSKLPSTACGIQSSIPIQASQQENHPPMKPTLSALPKKLLYLEDINVFGFPFQSYA